MLYIAIPPDLVAVTLCDDLSFISSNNFLLKKNLFEIKINIIDRVSDMRPKVIPMHKFTFFKPTIINLIFNFLFINNI